MLAHMPELPGHDEHVVRMFKANVKGHAVHLVPGLESSPWLLIWQVHDQLPLKTLDSKIQR